MANTGFSLIESITIIAIISILTGISVSALPAIRSHQALVADTEQIRSLLLDSKQRALNQVRPAACVEKAEQNGQDSRRCSDVGITFTGGKVVQYADVRGNLRYDSNESDDHNDSDDYVIAEHDLLSVVVNQSSVNHFVFYGNPPTVDLYIVDGDIAETVNPTLVQSLPGGAAQVVLLGGQGRGKMERTLKISSFGTIDIE